MGSDVEYGNTICEDCLREALMLIRGGKVWIDDDHCLVTSKDQETGEIGSYIAHETRRKKEKE